MCPRGCPGTVHAHGCYERYADAQGSLKEKIRRFLCRPCGVTFSVLPSHRLPYRSIRADRLQGDFDKRAGIQAQSLDPPPRPAEAGCLQRAWSAFSARVSCLSEAFGQLVECKPVPASLWKGLRQSMNSLSKMLCFLSEHHRISLLANYHCLRPPS